MLAKLCVVAALFAPVFASGKVELAMMFQAHPSGKVNHCPPVSTTMLQTKVADGELQFVGTSAPAKGAPSLVWTSETVGQTNTTWNEVGNLTLVSDAGVAQGSVTFASFGYSGNIGPTISFQPSVSYGAITYQITGGSGVWEGAQGIMTDSFVADGDVETFPINAWAIFWVPK